MRRLLWAVSIFFAFSPLVQAAPCPAGTTYVKGDSASFVNETVPDAMAYGKSYAVSITFCNNGSTTWAYRAPPPGGNYAGTNSYIRLGAVTAPGVNPWGLLRADLSPGDAVAPGSVKTFSFNVAAPGGAASSVATPFQWGVLRERVAWFGVAPRIDVDSYATPVIALQNTPQKTPAGLPLSDFGFANFAGANVINESYTQAGGNHRLWIPGAAQMAVLAARAQAMNLKYLRMPLVIPPAVSSSEYVASEWYAAPGAANANQVNVNAVIGAAQTALQIANSYGLKMILVLDGYTEYDTACNAKMGGGRLWKKSFNAVQANARQIVSALSSNSALFAWDLMNEPLWNASAFGCLDAAPGAFDRGTQMPLLPLPSGASASVQSYTEVVEAVHAMYNLVRANDPYNHPTTVGEGRAPFLHYWNDISSFASPHVYYSPQDIINEQVQSNKGQIAALQVTQFGGAPSSRNQWHVGDPMIQALLPGLLNATMASMQAELAGGGRSIPLVIGEFGTSFPQDVPTAAEQGNYYSLTLLSPAGSLQSLNLGNMLWDLSEGNQAGNNFSTIGNTGNLLPAACVVAKVRGAQPTGC